MKKKLTILLLSGWQYYNIGDMAHTPGLLNLLNLYLPDARIILWPRHQVRAINDMLRRKFPDLEIMEEKWAPEPQPDGQVMRAAKEADFLLHGSGPTLVGYDQITWWRRTFNKPYGIYGITLQEVQELWGDLINHASFMFTRETDSLKHLQQAGVNCPITGFVPDSTFAMDIRDDYKAVHFMDRHELEPEKFICVIPRLRVTPYYQTGSDWSAEKIRETDELNERHKEIDHAKARHAIITWVRQTGHKALICPEMTYQMGVMEELLIRPLPPDVRNKVIRREDYWLCDEAAALYDHAAAVLSFECHSPIMACYHNTPAFYLRQPQDTVKGRMWYDVGLNDWVFEIEQTDGQAISDRLMHVYDHPWEARRYLESAMDTVRDIQRDSMMKVRGAVGL